MTLKSKFATLRLISTKTLEPILHIESSNISAVRWDSEDVVWRGNAQSLPIHATSPQPPQSCCHQFRECGIWIYDKGIWAKTSLSLIPRTTRTLRVWDEFVLVSDPQILQLDVCNSHKFSWKEVALESVFLNYSFYLANGSLNIATFVFVHYKKKTKPILACFITASIGSVVSYLLAAWSMSLKDNFKLPTEII